MGGQNHQPCGDYLLNSTLLSRNLSVARSELELANIALEDLIIAELNRDSRNGSLNSILVHLKLSENSVEHMITNCHALRNQMNNNDYSEATEEMLV